MSLWRRAPREVYRVYGEDEYLKEDAAPVEYSGAEYAVSGHDARPEDEARPTEYADYSTAEYAAQARATASPEGYVPRNRADTRQIVSPPSHRSRSRRLVGFGLLMGATIGAIGLVALNVSHRPGFTSRAGRPGDGGAPSASDGSATQRTSTHHRTAGALNNISSTLSGSHTADPRARVSALAPLRARQPNAIRPASRPIYSVSASAFAQLKASRLPLRWPSGTYATSMEPSAPRSVASELLLTEAAASADEFGFER